MTPTTLRRVIKNTGGIFLARVLDLLAGILVVSLVTRGLSQEAFGRYVWLWAVVLFFQPLINFETDKLLMRNVARSPLDWQEDASAVLSLKLSLFLGAALVLLGVSPWVTTGDVEAWCLLLAVASEFFYHPGFLFNAILYGRERMEYDPLITLLAKVVHLGGAALAFLTGAGIPGFVLAALAGNMMRFWVGWRVLERQGAAFSVRLNAGRAGELLREAAPVTLAAFLTHTALKVDVYLLNLLASAGEVARFHLPHMLVLQAQIVPLSLGGALLPRLARTFQVDRRRYAVLVSGIGTLFLGLGLSTAVVLQVAGEPFIVLLSGEAYRPAAAIFGGLVWAMPALFLNFFLANNLILMGRQRLIPWSSGVTLGTNVVLDALLIPGYGAWGAVIGTITAYTLGTLLLGAFVAVSLNEKRERQ